MSSFWYVVFIVWVVIMLFMFVKWVLILIVNCCFFFVN